ncbi:alpha-2-macroglobulin-like protein 1 [Eleutherodactylus coqui]|uniref:alpha-2-macroglobulin-like protein 1 n=1 Tax=Eleutherodactylus coqui TaxID=57060 RepID=UPI0034624C97
MWHQLLLLTCCFIPSSSILGQSSSINYLLLVPAEIHFPSNETLYVDIRGAQESLKVTVTLQRSVDDDILLQEKVTECQFVKRIQFQTPPPEGGEEVVAVHLSIVGRSTQLSESKNILIRAVSPATVIQTDKPMYKRQETVNFQILTLSEDFLAVDDTISRVEIQDPNKNRIGQWLNLKPKKGIVNLSYSLDSEAQLGAYTIICPHAHQDFHVAEYVVPTFGLAVQLPDVVTILEERFPLKICGRYTFGKPVQGEITAELCRKAICYHGLSPLCPVDICREYKGKTDKNGCLEVEVSTEQYNFRSYYYKLTFEAQACLVEDGTGIEINATASCGISANMATVTFDADMSDTYYKTGLKYKSKMILKSAAGKPMKSTLYLTEKYGMTTKEHVYMTNEDGEAYFTLDTKKWNGLPVDLTATYQKKKPERNFDGLNPYVVDAQRTLQPFTTITKSFLKVQPIDHLLSCEQEHLIEIDYILRNSEMLPEQDNIEINYVFMSKGNLMWNGKMNVKMDNSSVTIGTAVLPLNATANHAPILSIFVYAILSNGKIAADTQRFSIAKCFNNKVTMDFSEQKASPGSSVTLSIKAEPGSLCSVRAVDEGVLLLRPESEISRDMVYNFVSRRNEYGYPYRVQEEDNLCWKPRRSFSFSPPYSYKRRKRSYRWPTLSNPDVATLLKRIALKYITNTQVKTPPECVEFPIVAASNSLVLPDPIYDSGSSLPSTIVVDDFDGSLSHTSMTITELTNKIRTRFPETWMWELLTVGPSGQVELPVQLPDSVTEWKTTAFCMGDTGLGIAPTTSVLAFQPFFLDMNYPYSVVKGEQFPLSATVFNYLTSPMKVKFDIKKSEDLQMSDCPQCNIPQCLLPQQTVVYTWNAKALRIGAVEIQLWIEAIDTQELCEGQRPIVPNIGASDSLIKTVLVKAEGVTVEKSHNSILCGAGKTSSETISIKLPPAVVPGSAVAMFSVVGDLMGSALQGMEQLLQLPYGCGEQVMAMSVPNIHILDYLASANLLSEEVKKQGTAYILHGYQRGLKYRRDDGSFSPFGDRDEEGNTWLSAFAMKFLHGSARYIYVDKKYIQDITAWLRKNLQRNGCFKNRGKLFKSSIKGGVNDEISLCAYTTAALLECEHPLEDEMVQSALRYLRKASSQVDSLYTKALLVYLFTLSQDYKLRSSLLSELHAKAVDAGGDTYWPANPSNVSKDSLWSEPNSNEVEMASYVLLSHLSVANRTKMDMNKASRIVQWVVKQQNPYGGFANTQDTVAALQALARFCLLTYSKHEGLEIIFSPDGGETEYSFHVDEETRFLLQTKQLQKLPGDYKVQAEGKGCVFLKTTLKYNIYPNKDSQFFQVQLNLTAGHSKDKAKLTLQYTIYLRYVGQRNKTNMVLVEAELPSGFEASLEELRTNKLVKRTERKERKVILYIEELDKKCETFTFSAEQQVMVKDLKPCSIKVYDYYQTGEEICMMYTTPKL